MPTYSAPAGAYFVISVPDQVNFSSSTQRAPMQLPAQPRSVQPAPSALAQGHDGSENNVRINGTWYAPLVNSGVAIS